MKYRESDIQVFNFSNGNSCTTQNDGKMYNYNKADVFQYIAKKTKRDDYQKILKVVDGVEVGYVFEPKDESKKATYVILDASDRRRRSRNTSVTYEDYFDSLRLTVKERRKSEARVKNVVVSAVLISGVLAGMMYGTIKEWDLQDRQNKSYVDEARSATAYETILANKDKDTDEINQAVESALTEARLNSDITQEKGPTK